MKNANEQIYNLLHMHLRFTLYVSKLPAQLIKNFHSCEQCRAKEFNSQDWFVFVFLFICLFGFFLLECFTTLTKYKELFVLQKKKLHTFQLTIRNFNISSCTK